MSTQVDLFSLFLLLYTLSFFSNNKMTQRGKFLFFIHEWGKEQMRDIQGDQGRHSAGDDQCIALTVLNTD